MRGSHGFVAFLPAEGAYLTILFEVLQSVDNADSLVDAATQRHVIYQTVAHNAVFVDKEQAAVGYFIAILCQYIVGCGNLFIDVGDKWVSYPLNTALITRGVGPGPVAELAVGGATDNCRVAFLELSQGILEADQLCGAYKGEVLGVEEQDHVLVALVLLEAEVALDVAVYDCVRAELRCFFSY